MAAGVPGSDRLGGGIPSIFDIQEHVEDAWDRGINAYGRVQTGGIRNTRKYIGTPEVSIYGARRFDLNDHIR